MANTKVTSNVLADDAVTISKIHTQTDSGGSFANQDPSDGHALVAKTNTNGYHLSWESVGVSGISSSADATAITINSSEQVGIGTSSINARLVVSDSGDSPVRFISSGQATNYFELANTGGSAMVFSNNNDLVFGTSNSPTERMRIDSSGNVAVGATGAFGTTSNRTVLSVNGTSSATLNIGTGGTQKGYLFSDGSFTQVASVGSIPLRLGTNDTARMTIDGSGFIGMGTTTPSSYNSYADNLVVADSAHCGISIVAGNTSQSTLMFADGTGGTAGYRGRVGYDHNADVMVFHTAAAEAARFDSNGRFNLGAVAHSADINQAMLNVFINSSSIPTCRFAQGSTSSSVPVIRCRHENSSSGFYIDFRTDENVVTGTIKDVSGTMTYASASDSRLKNNVETMPEGLTEVLAMNPVKFTWDEKKGGGESRGFLAQELNNQYSWAVQEGGDDPYEDSWQIDYSKLTPILVKAIQEQQTIIDDLKARVETLESN